MLRRIIGALILVIALAVGAGGVRYVLQHTHAAPSSEAPVSIVPPGPFHQPSSTVHQGKPQWISIPGVLAKTALNPNGVSGQAGRVVPADDRPVFWNESNLPGTDASGTAVILGHNYATSGEQPPFAALQQIGAGDAVLIGVPAGTLRYKVQQVVDPPKKNPLAGLQDPVPGRLLLITCMTKGGEDTYYNHIVVAQLDM